MPDSNEPVKSKTEQARDLVVELRDTLQLAAGGVDPRVEAVLQKFEDLLTPVV